MLSDYRQCKAHPVPATVSRLLVVIEANWLHSHPGARPHLCTCRKGEDIFGIMLPHES